MANTTTGAASAPKPSSSVKLVLLGEAAVGKVRVITSYIRFRPTMIHPPGWMPRCHICCASLAWVGATARRFLRLLWEDVTGFVIPSEVLDADRVPPFQSSLVLRFVNNDFQENKEPTIGGMT